MTAEARTWRAFFKMHGDIMNLKDARVLPNRLMVGARVSYEGENKFVMLEISMRERGTDRVFLAISRIVGKKSKISVSGTFPDGQEIAESISLRKLPNVQALIVKKLEEKS